MSVAEVLCSGGAGGPQGHTRAAYSLIIHEMCMPIAHMCWQCVGPRMVGTVLAWMDDGGDTVCPFCQKPVLHLEDWMKLTTTSGTPIGEAWKRFLREHPESST